MSMAMDNLPFTLGIGFTLYASFRKWVHYWNRYERVAMSENYTLHHELVTYRERIQNCNTKYYWEFVYTYDKQFQAELALTQAF